MMKKAGKVNQQTFSEQGTRQKILQDARRCFGPEGVRQLQMMFKKYDDLLARCTNDSEREHIKKIAAADIFTAMGYRGGLSVDGIDVIPSDE
jgi:hypothetical protein